jgi:hypothetical protein
MIGAPLRFAELCLLGLPYSVEIGNTDIIVPINSTSNQIAKPLSDAGKNKKVIFKWRKIIY